MNLKLEFSTDRLGPDLPLTHFLMNFKFIKKWLIKKKIHKTGENFDLRPYVSIVGGKNISIGNNITLRPFTQIHASSKEGGAQVTIEDDVLIAPDVFITTNNHNFANINKPIRLQGGTSKSVLIKSGSWIARGATILPGITIGENAVVAAGSVVTKDVPSFCVVAGVPAKVIKKIEQ